MSDYVFTAHMTTVSNLLWAVTSAVGAGLCFFVLLVIGAVWIHPKSRPYLDRVSFRLVTAALLANMLFGISSAVGGMLTGPGFLCGFSIFILQLTLQISSVLLFSIALNLQFVVVHGFNGQNMEKSYFIVSILLPCILTIPPYAAGQYGWDVLEQDCWYTNDNRGQRLAWQIATQMIWTAIMALGEIVSSITVMMFMLKHTVRTRRIFVSTDSMSRDTSTAPQVIHANNYKQIILRIALYPLASCLVNLLSIFTALHSTVANGIHNNTDYNILLLSDFLYGGRAIVYAMLAASDPVKIVNHYLPRLSTETLLLQALVRGVKALYHAIRGLPLDSSMQKTHTTVLSTTPSNGLVVHIELETIQSTSAKLDPEHSTEPFAVSSLGNKGSINASGDAISGAPSTTTDSQHQRDISTSILQREVIRSEEDAFNRQI